MQEKNRQENKEKSILQIKTCKCRVVALHDQSIFPNEKRVQ